MRPAEIITLIQCLDLTILSPEDTPKTISQYCQKALTPFGNVAAVCVSPALTKAAFQALITTEIPVATVANFPTGLSSENTVAQEIKQAILDGAAEIDVVLPYFYYKTGEREKIRHFIETCKETCGKMACLKVILETGALTPEEIQKASEDSINAGADFLKTSTGKIATGATLSAAEIMLSVIRRASRVVGFKVSGGIRTLPDAYAYAKLVQHYLGKEAFHPTRYRIGASSLLPLLLEKMYEYHSSL